MEGKGEVSFGKGKIEIVARKIEIAKRSIFDYGVILINGGLRRSQKLCFLNKIGQIYKPFLVGAVETAENKID